MKRYQGIIKITGLEAYFLHPLQFIPFMTTQDGYDAFVMYWNEKVDDDIRYGKGNMQDLSRITKR